MHIVVCVDERDGMLFNRRRVSSDKALTQKILKIVQNTRLWMNGYSAKLFAGFEDRITVAEDYLRRAESGDYCFAETADLLPYRERIESVLLCCWNRKYPADTHFPRQLLEGASLESEEEIVGNSHETVTIRRYVL